MADGLELWSDGLGLVPQTDDWEREAFRTRPPVQQRTFCCERLFVLWAHCSLEAAGRRMHRMDGPVETLLPLDFRLCLQWQDPPNADLDPDPLTGDDC